LLLLLLLQVLTDNPLADFVELPDEYRALRYSNLLPGVIRGGLEMVRPFVVVLAALPAAALHLYSLDVDSV
jgi:hypothetical protein